MHYEANWESLDQRRVPKWFADAKFGIFIHWGVYSVPAYCDPGKFSEWYQCWLEHSPRPEVVAYHKQRFGARSYKDLAELFTAELYDPKAWVKLFERAGARYLNITSKHHDGYCLYDAPLARGWNSVDVGPRRDLCMELREACEDSPVKFGVYHSIMDWNQPLCATRQFDRYALEYLHPMMKDLIERYQPHTLFTDGEWDEPDTAWHSVEFLQWLYNDSSTRDFIVPNDRWGKGTRTACHGGNATTEYGSHDGRGEDYVFQKPFEECRGIGKSFGYNRAEPAENYVSADKLIELLLDQVSKGGNLLLNIGPTGDGRIPPIMEERLLAIGDWLSVYGDGIYASRKGPVSHQDGVWYTAAADGSLYAFLRSFPFGDVVLEDISYDPTKTASLPGFKGESNPVEIFNADGRIGLRFRPFPPEALEAKCCRGVRLG
ncbi:MAG: alpha-L-fucosidase [Oscillospiraceae bacterium]|jgi:alpha-L-fucosidase|nr:alpha-L-fucosidase [Oscillospiraceae bacterium]